MPQKKIMISLPEEVLNDADALVKAGFYKNRSDLIYEGLMGIAPLKRLVDERHGKRLDELLVKANALTGKICA